MKKTFWDRIAKIYDRFMRKDNQAYEQMCSMICPVVRHKQVLELATGTGLIAPNFTPAASDFGGKVKAFLMEAVGFREYNKWTSEKYLAFLREQGWQVRKSEVLKASFPLTYAECVKGETR